MPWYNAFSRRSPAALTAAAAPVQSAPAALTAAAARPKGPTAQYLRHPDKWQNEVWSYYDNLGEFNYGVWWLSNMLSRVRLRAAKLQPDADEPEIETKGPAAELMMRLGGGVTGQAQLMKRLTVQLSIPGEGYLIGEQDGKREQWMVRSVDEIRAQSGTYYVMDENNVTSGQEWREISKDSLVTRVWRPHDRYYHLADSPARSARDIMRELELVNRKIAAEYLSRLASAGLLALPDNLTFPVREEFADEPNPLVAEFIEIAAQAIEKPGTASSVIPIPIIGDPDAIDKIKHIDFTLKMDEKIIEKRESAIKRLATKLDLPAEILLGMGDVNHWGAWQLEEGALKAHIAPVAELICDSLTRGYLGPRLEASGEDPTDWVVWYDMSELALRPDRSGNATLAYDRLELTGEAYRRELGFDEDDAPSQEDLVDIGLKILLKTVPNAAPSALDKLTGRKVLSSEDMINVRGGTPGAPQAAPTGSPAASGTGKAAPRAAPPTKENAPPAAAQAARNARLLKQSQTQHVLKFQAADRRWELMHPQLCHEHEYSCPYTHAVSRNAPAATPGRSGLYLCHLDSFGRLLIDGPASYMDARDFISTSLVPVVNGSG
jgi:hypothetical protein